MYFSVIVPVYGIEDCLCDSVDSILNQSFEDFELILVDDGSPDKCPDICDAYAEKNGRVRVIHKENGGQADARKAGLQLAKGKYIVYIDGDDMVEESMLEDACKLIEKYHVDIVSFAYTSGTGSDRAAYSRAICEPVAEGYYDKERMEREIYPKLLSDKYSKAMFYTLWMKAIKRELIYSCQMDVDSRSRLCEDIMCIVPAYLKADRIYISHKVEYYYRYRPESSGRLFQTSKFYELILGLQFFEKLPVSYACDFSGQIDRYALSISFNMLDAAAKGGDREQLSEICRYFEDPVLKRHISDAHLKKMTVKKRITARLMRLNKIKYAWRFLRACALIKERFG